MEAFQSGVSVPLLADLSSLHGLYDLSVLPHGLLASHYHLLINPHLTAGSWHSAYLCSLHGGGVSQGSSGKHGRGHLLCQWDLQIAGVPGCSVCGVLWRIRDCIWGVECHGQHHHLGPLIL